MRWVYSLVLMHKARRNIVTSEEQTRFYMSPLRQKKKSVRRSPCSFAYCIFFKQSWKCGIHNFLCLSVLLSLCILPFTLHSTLLSNTSQMKNMHNCLHYFYFSTKDDLSYWFDHRKLNAEKCMPHDIRMNVE